MLLEQLTRIAEHSLNVHFELGLKDKGHVHVEGRRRIGTDKYPLYEIRIDGPDIKTYTRGNWKLTYDLNIAVQTARNDKDLYHHTKNKAHIYKLLDGSIPILDLDKDCSTLDCFNRDGDVITTDFDLVQNNLKGSTIEATYTFTWDN